MNNIKTASLLNKEGGAVLLVGIKISGDLKGLIFDGQVTQYYRNDADQAVEVIYNFPLPYGAVLLNVEVNIGEASLTGRVVEKSIAIEGYENLVSSGDSAIMIERTKDHNYCMNLGNLAASERCVITLRYAQVLRYEQGGLRLQIPTVLAPRYGDPVIDGQYEIHQIYKNDLLASHDFDLTIRIHDQLTLARISSPSHAISLKKIELDDQSSCIEIGLGRSYELDRDFVLIIDELNQASVGIQSPDFADQSKNVAFISFRPEEVNDQLNRQVTPISLKILVDCSGSMAGDSIDSVAEALKTIVDEFRPEDRFSLSRFGNDVEHRSRGLWQVGPASLKAAHRWIDALHANMGGTRLGSALSSTISHVKHVPSDILLITDGEVHAIDYVIEVAKASKQRVFVVGIGSSPVESHLRRLAYATHGACEFIAPGEVVLPAVIRMLTRLRSPAYTDLRVVWPDEAKVEYQTQADIPLCNGDALNIFAWTKKPVIGEVQLYGKTHKDAEKKVLAAVSMQGVREGDAVSRLAAYERLNTEIIDGSDLAITYQLVGNETAMLLERIRADDQKQKDMPTLYKISQMVPAGWAGMGAVTDTVRYMRKPFENDFLFSRKSTLDRPLNEEDKLKLLSGITKSLKDRSRRDPDPRLLKSIFNQQTPSQQKVKDALKNTQDEVNTGKSSNRIKPIDRTDPLLWLDQKEFHGLTPMGIAEWLRLNGHSSLPLDFEFIGLIGVPIEVIDWLDLLFSNKAGDVLGEEMAVRVFINVMRNTKTIDYLQGLITPDDWMAEVSNGLVKKDRSDCSPEITVKMIKAFVPCLNGMKATEWPIRVSKADQQL